MALSQEKQTVAIRANVVDAYSLKLLPGVEVTASKFNISDVSDALGGIRLEVPKKDLAGGTLKIRLSKNGYQSQDRWISIADNPLILTIKPTVQESEGVQATDFHGIQVPIAVATNSTSMLKLYELVERSGRLEAAKFSPDGKFLLIAVDNVSALDLDTGNILFDLEAKDVRQIGFNHAGTLVATAEFNGTVRLWDVKTGHERFSFSGHHFPLSSLSFSQDDRLLLATSVDGSARILDSVSGREISQLWGHRNGILTGTFNPQGDRVVTASMDGTARIWDTKTGENVGYIANSNSAMLFCSYTENADRIITVSADGTVAIHAAGIKELLELAEKELTNVMTVRPSGHNLVR
jgi:WD40 repeat protein